MGRTRVLIIDDSGFARSILSKGLALDPEIDVIGSASDPIEAQKEIQKLKPDVLTLDVQMPNMNGIEFLHKIMSENPLPVVMVSSFTEKNSKITIDALMAGAVDYVLKPVGGSYDSLSKMVGEIRDKIKTAAISNVKRVQTNPTDSPVRTLHNVPLDDTIIVIGASTGGVDAVTQIIKKMPLLSPGIVIVQHMPAEFTGIFAERLNNITHFEVSEAKNWAQVLPGKVFIAPGDKHVQIQKLGHGNVIKLVPGKPVNGHIPSVDVLFRSVAQYARKKAVAVILTGMGNDGASGLLELRKAGAKTIIQDSESSVIFGMPGEAFKLGAADKLTALSDIPLTIGNYIKDIINGK